jgi:hypothetical protein
MKRTRFIVLALVLSVAVVASFEMSAVASGGADSAKKKCKKGYKRNKKGKCKKKKVTPKVGFFIGQASGGNGEVRLRLTPHLPPSRGNPAAQYINLFSGSAKATCSNGTQQAVGLRSTGKVHGKTFTPYEPARPLAGSFSTATKLSGTVRSAITLSSGVTCDTGVVSFTAKWAGT